MYSPKPIPKPFQGTLEKTKQTEMKESATLSVPIEAKEKIIESPTTRQNSLSPLAALLFWDLFCKKKGDE